MPCKRSPTFLAALLKITAVKHGGEASCGIIYIRLKQLGRLRPMM